MTSPKLTRDVVSAYFCPRWASLLACRYGRIIVYALALTILASEFCFFRLHAGTLFGDEAAFACTTDHMRATGDWVVPFIGDNPHLNATPLYNWLTVAAAPWFDESPLWYRFWSAVSGIGCVLLAFALGTFLFRPEAGLLAGLLLVFNRGFLFDHGIRFGGMDAMLTFFVTAATLCYAWLYIKPGRAYSAWGLLGVCIGLACLTKPPVFGVFFFTLITLHWLIHRRGESLAVRTAGPVLAAAIATLIAAPWYFLLWRRLGNGCLYSLFIYNSLERALDRTVRDPFCCHRAIWHSSSAFKLVEAAFACAVGSWAARYRRQEWGLLLFLAGGYLLALTAAGKPFQYIYYPFPLLAVLLAGLFLESGPFLLAWVVPKLARTAVLVGVAVAAVLISADCLRALRILGGPAWTHPPFGIYERLAPELAQRHCRYVLFGFHLETCNFEDLYYQAHMPLANRVRDLKELSALLEDGTPILVLLPPITSPQPQLAGLRPEIWLQENPWPIFTYTVLAFNGGSSLIPAAELTRLARGNQ